MNKFFILMISFVLIFSCGKKKKRRYNVPPQPVVRKKIKRKEKKKEKKEELYIYQGYKYRNPFRPLVGLTSGKSIKIKSEVTSTETGLNIDAFTLQGIMVDSEGRKYALLVGGDGMPYVLKGRKLIDANGKLVPDVTGSVMEKKVIIIKGGKTATLSLPENQ